MKRQEGRMAALKDENQFSNSKLNGFCALNPFTSLTVINSEL